MEIEIKTWLQDIDRSIDEIYSFLPVKRDFFGEALNRILKKNPSIQISDSRKIVDTRNRIIHSYDSVTEDIIWLISIKYLPILKKEVQALLKK